MASKSKVAQKRSRSRQPLTLDRVEILRQFGTSKPEPIAPTLVARALDIETGDPDAKLCPADRAFLMLHGVASTLDTLGAPMLSAENDGDEQSHGEALWFLSKTIHRAIRLILAATPGGNALPSAYRIKRPDPRRAA